MLSPSFRMALAEAQALAIRKLLSKSAYDNTVTPGPPLPKSHPPPGLVAKLHLECASLFSSARSLVKTASGPKSKTKFKPSWGKNKGTDEDANEGSVEGVAPELKRYLADEAALHSALASKWLGVDCGESGGLDRTGQAVGYLQWTRKELEGLKDGAKSGIVLPGVSSENGKQARDRRKTVVARELETVNIFLKHYRSMNDTVRWLYSDRVTDHTHPLNSPPFAVRSHSNPFPLRLNCKPSFLQENWRFRQERTSPQLQLLVLDLQVMSRVIYRGSRSQKGRHPWRMTTVSRQRRPRTILGRAPIFDPSTPMRRHSHASVKRCPRTGCHGKCPRTCRVQCTFRGDIHRAIHTVARIHASIGVARNGRQSIMQGQQQQDYIVSQGMSRWLVIWVRCL